MKAPSNPILHQTKLWHSNSNTIWLASSMTLMRNVEKFKFPGKLSTDRKRQIVDLAAKNLLQNPSLQQPELLKAEEMGYLDKEFLVEHFLSFHNFHQANGGEGFIVDRSGEFLATLNLNDHIQIQLLDCKGELENCWSRVVAIESSLSKEISYCFSPKFGFLTADPTQCGTALLGSVFLQLSALIHSGKIDEVLQQNLDDSMLVYGIQGSPNEIIGDIVVIQNNYTLGLTEENIISSLRSVTTKLLVEENSMRNQIKKEEKADYKDKVSRAFAILMFSYQLEAIEALNALSLLKLGLDVGWIQGIDNERLNTLFFNCRRSHLLSLFPQEKISQEEIPHKRAAFIHQALKDVKLAI